jgi:hypothetical protein
MAFVEPKETPLGTSGFAGWYRATEPLLRKELCAAYGPERGREDTSEALAWAWEHRDCVATMEKPLASGPSPRRRHDPEE